MASDLSEASSYADAQADTPTIGGENQSDSEDTLSSLSFDEVGILSPASGGSDLDLDRKSPKMITTATSLGAVSSRQAPPVATPRTKIIPEPSSQVDPAAVDIQVRVTTPDAMESHRSGSPSFPLDLDLPSPSSYKPATVDFPASPSQLKIQLGADFFPKEEPSPGRLSEDDVSFASSCRAKLDLNFQNGGVRLTKRDDGESEPSSLLVETQDQLEDYIEDFYLPLSHESVMQRQTSFRRKVQKQLETAATERAITELSKFENMLSTYDEEDEVTSPEPPPPLNFDYTVPPGVRSRSRSNSTETESYPSFVDIDAICNTHAPNLMRTSDDHAASIGFGDTEESGYFIPKTTIDKLYAVYDSTNFNNLYTLSGELRHILTPVEIEEIVANRVHLEKVINPNVMAALSWSLTEASLPPYDLSLQQQPPKKISDSTVDYTPSKTSSISNGFYSRNTSDASDDEVSTTSTPMMSGRCSSGFDTPDSAMVNGAGDVHQVFERGATETSSFRKRIAFDKTLISRVGSPGVGDDEEYNSITLSYSPTMEVDGADVSPEKNSSLGELDFEDDNGDLCFVRRDSKRFGKNQGSDDRVVQGLFVETKGSRSNQGTLTRVRVDLNLGQLEKDGDLFGASEEILDVKKVAKKRVPLEESLLRTNSISDLEDSSQATDADVTLSEVFHSCLSPSGPLQEDLTMRSGSVSTEGDDLTVDLDTPDDMADSILGRLDSISAAPLPQPCIAPEESAQWKSFSVGSTEIQIDLRAIQPYRRVVSHGGYFDAEKKVAIILFSGCFLPDRNRREYLYIMDQLFLYVLSTLEELIVDDYVLVYLHGATPKSSQPSFGWLKRCYQLLDRKLRKNLKGLYLVHPSFWLRTVVALTKPFVSSKFSNKLQFVNTLAELCLELPTEHLVIPEPVLQYDFDLKVSALKRQMT